MCRGIRSSRWLRCNDLESPLERKALIDSAFHLRSFKWHKHNSSHYFLTRGKRGQYFSFIAQQNDKVCLRTQQVDIISPLEIIAKKIGYECMQQVPGSELVANVWCISF